MSTKETVIHYLEENSGHPVSGSTIAEALGISRTAVWKAIKSLEAEGYMIDASSGKGYTLRSDNDILSAAGICKYLEEPALGPVIVHQTVSSTNDLLKEAALEGPDAAPEGMMIVASEQTRGRGRKGRSFFSPDGTGVYFSCLLRPVMDVARAGQITTMAAVAVAEAIKKYGVSDVGVKWVNDVYVAGRKACGILAEATTSLETGEFESVVVGIGLNIYTPEGGFPEDIKDRAGSILGETRVGDARNRLVAYTYQRLYDLYNNAGWEEISRRYRELCFVPGRQVLVLQRGQERPAKAVSLNEQCHLLVKYEDESEEWLSSGEVSLKL